MPNGRERDIRHKRQRGDRGPRRKRAIIRLGHAPRQISIERVSIYLQWRGALDRPFTGRNSPGKATIPAKLIRVLNGMFSVDMRGAAAVLEVVNVTPAHRFILNAAKIDPDMWEL